MGKSVRYKLNKPARRKAVKRKNVSKKEDKKKDVKLFKYLRLLVLFVVLCGFGYWLFVAYTTVKNVRIHDVVDEQNEVVDFAQESQIKKTIIQA